ARGLIVSVDITALAQADAALDRAIDLLNAGVTRIVASADQIDQLRDTVDESRLVLAAESNYPGAAPRGGVLVAFNGAVVSSLKNAANTPTYVSFGAAPTLENIKAVSAAAAIPVIPASALTVDPAANPALLSVA